MVLRQAILAMMAWLTEIQTHYEINETPVSGRAAKVVEIYGKSGKRRAHQNVGPLVELLRALVESQGSDETTARAIDRTHGQAALARAARNHIYMLRVRDAFAAVQAVSVGIDGSCHGGPSVLCGYIVDTKNEVGAYLEPEVRNYKEEEETAD